MAAATSGTQNCKTDVDDVKNNKDSVSESRWKECEPKSIYGSLEACKAAMESVKDEFFKTLKDKFGFDDKAIKDMIYVFSDSGICLILCPPALNGYNYFTGLVQIKAEELLPGGASGIGGLWASIRVRVPYGLEKEKNKLQGCIISLYPNINFVQDNQYSCLPWWYFRSIKSGKSGKSGKSIDESKNDGNGKLSVSLNPPPCVYPKNWQPVKGSSLETCQTGLNDVKSEFFKLARLCGYNGSEKEYTFTDVGICCLFKDPLIPGYSYFIGLVKLETFIEFGLAITYYASIRFSESVGIGTVPPVVSPFVLEGFKISCESRIQWVDYNVQLFGRDVKPDGKIISLTSTSKEKGNGKNEENIIFIPSGMDYIPTGAIQQTVNSLKNEIKKKCGIIGDLDTFQVVSATACNSTVKCMIHPVFFLCFF